MMMKNSVTTLFFIFMHLLVSHGGFASDIPNAKPSETAKLPDSSYPCPRGPGNSALPPLRGRKFLWPTPSHPWEIPPLPAFNWPKPGQPWALPPLPAFNWPKPGQPWVLPPLPALPPLPPLPAFNWPKPGQPCALPPLPPLPPLPAFNWPKPGKPWVLPPLPALPPLPPLPAFNWPKPGQPWALPPLPAFNWPKPGHPWALPPLPHLFPPFPGSKSPSPQDAGGGASKCWSALNPIENCVQEIISSLQNGKIDVGLACCKAVADVKEDCSSDAYGIFKTPFFQQALEQHCSSQAAPAPPTKA